VLLLAQLVGHGTGGTRDAVGEGVLAWNL